MFEHDHAAARGEMAACELIVFEHEHAMGDAPAHALFDTIKVERVAGSAVLLRGAAASGLLMS